MNKTLKQKQEQKQTVQRAIIMAAGLSSRFAPLSYERPKGLLVVHGEVLIERQIRQLQAAGVTEIIVVTGYLGQQYAYLADAFGVRLVANPYYQTRNNHSSLWVVADKLEDAWICSSDNYFLENPFLETPVEATYALVEQTAPANEYFVTLDEAAKISDVVVGGQAGLIMLGHVYFSASFARTLRPLLAAAMQSELEAGLLWEDIMIKNLSQFHMLGKVYPNHIIFEFDTLDELRIFDPSYHDTTQSEVIAHICNQLGCAQRDVIKMRPLKQAQIAFAFEVHRQAYRYDFTTHEVCVLEVV